MVIGRRRERGDAKTGIRRGSSGSEGVRVSVKCLRP
jgi:hypothetical protein